MGYCECCCTDSCLNGVYACVCSNEMVKDKGLNCRFVIARKPDGTR